MISRSGVRACRISRPLVLHSPVAIQRSARFASLVHDNNATERIISQPGGRGGGELQNTLIHKGTVTTDKPHSTDMTQLLEVLKPVSSPISVPGDSMFQLAVLLTPFYAQHALNLEFPLKIFSHIGLSDQQSPQPLSAFMAVVDKLPSPTAHKTGSEGIAFLLQSVSDLPNKSFQTPANPSSQKPGFLTFGIRNPLEALDGCDVQFTLAQTIFCTGKPSTLQHVQYEYNESSGRREKCVSQTLEAQKLILPPAKSMRSETYLTPLTPFRTVRSCVGNIVRSLSEVTLSEGINTNQKSDQSQPASQELETAISHYFIAQNINPEPVEVWALIAPDFTGLSTAYANPKQPLDSVQSLIHLSTDEIRERWTARVPDSAKKNDDIAVATMIVLQHGGRLCRVLSGGGGWGKKAGLLSLDPDLAYSTRELRADEGWKIDVDRHSLGGSAATMLEELEQVVRPGEHISFLLARSKSRLKNDDVVSRDGATFGTIPSTIDDVTAAGSHSGIGAKATGTIWFSETFGALSETGLGLSFTSAKGVTRSKFDVPFSRLHIDGMTL